MKETAHPAALLCSPELSCLAPFDATAIPLRFQVGERLPGSDWFRRTDRPDANLCPAEALRVSGAAAAFDCSETQSELLERIDPGR